MTSNTKADNDGGYELSFHTYRGLKIRLWRTDDRMEPPEDDVEAGGPFDIGDWYFAVEDWGVQTGASISSLGQATKAAESEIDKALGSGVTPTADKKDWFTYA